MKSLSSSYFRLMLLACVATFTFGFSHDLYAQSVTLSASKSSYAVGESILVTASVQTGGQQINTVGGQVTYSPSVVTVSDVRFGSSIITLWVDRPVANNSQGVINFTGGTPGGYSGNNGTLFTFVINPKTEGSMTVGLRDVHVLLNDGSGGEMQGLRLVPLTINVTPAKTPVPVKEPTKPTVPTGSTEVPTPTTTPVVSEVLPKDTIPPEGFVPMVSRHESIENGAYFVSFFSIDKDSGVTKYEVREVPKIFPFLATEWVEATSPHVLQLQSWGTSVEVRASDAEGNSVVSSTDKPFGSMALAGLAVLLVVMTAFVTSLFIKRPTHIRRNKK